MVGCGNLFFYSNSVHYLNLYCYKDLYTYEFVVDHLNIFFKAQYKLKKINLGKACYCKF